MGQRVWQLGKMRPRALSVRGDTEKLRPPIDFCYFQNSFITSFLTFREIQALNRRGEWPQNRSANFHQTYEHCTRLLP
jgi:hypothetical protein